MKRVLCMLICIIMLITFTLTYVVYGETLKENLEEQRNELSNQIDNANTELEEIQEEITTVSDQINSLNEKIAGYQVEVAELNANIQELEINLNKAKEELEQAQESYDKQKRLLEQRLVAMYELGETSYLDFLLSSKGLQDFISKYYLISEILTVDTNLLNDIEASKNDIEAKKEALDQKQEELKEAKTNKEKTAITLSNTKTVRNNYVNQLSEEEKEKQQDIDQYEKEMEELEAEILRVSEASMAGDYAGGEMAWPTPGYTRITSPFGMRIHPIFHVNRLHTGVDIGAPKGANVIAVNDGVVTSASFSTSYGNWIIIDHGGGVVTVYAHASKLIAKKGDIVKRGDVIMEVGSTGWSTGPHLHFEVRINGEYKDPLNFISSN